MDYLNLLIGSIGAVTGVISLYWHIINSRSKILLKAVSFEKCITKKNPKVSTLICNVLIQNRGNRSTTLEEIDLIIRNHIINVNHLIKKRELKANSSSAYEIKYPLDEEILSSAIKSEEIKLGVAIFHTFGELKKIGYTNFQTNWLNL